MTTECLDVRETELLDDLKNLMLNEGIRPQPEYQFFSKYLATSDRENFFDDEEEILNLINSHGVELMNDVKYWSNISKINGSSENVKKEIPVLKLNDFLLEDFNDVINKLKQLPSEWTVLQVTKKFTLNDITRKEEMPEIFLTRFACGDLAERIHPYSVTLGDSSYFQENIFKFLKNLTELRKEFYNLGRTNKKLCEAYYKTNSELESFIKELELYVLGPFICLFQGRMEDLSLEEETLAQVQKFVNSFCQEQEMEVMPNSKKIDLIYQLTCAAHLLKNKAMFSVLKLLYSENKSVVNISGLMMLIENLKILNLSNSCVVKRAKRQPLILIVDNEFEMVPWEMISSLSGQPVCRISSLQLLYSLYKYHEPFIQNGFRIVEVECTYCLINPGGDLQECEKKMKEFLKKRIPWAEVVHGKAPDAKDLLTKIGEYSAYLYCGHGSGVQYLRAKDLKKAFIKGLIMLFGCSSNIPKNRGGRTPHQNHTYTYISNGCPCIIGCIQDLGSTDADAACQEILSCIMPKVVNAEGVGVHQDQLVLRNTVDDDPWVLRIDGEIGNTVIQPKEPDVLRALASGRFACPRYWSKSAFVARGIPCKTVVGNINAMTAFN